MPARCFSCCTAVDTSDAAWRQSILALCKEGLGLRSLYQHAPATYIAPNCSTGFGSQTNPHLGFAVADFNSFVPPDKVLHIDSLLSASSDSQKWLSYILDTHMFNLLLDASSTTDRVRLLSVSSPHASAWPSVVPSKGMGLHPDPPVHQLP